MSEAERAILSKIPATATPSPGPLGRASDREKPSVGPASGARTLAPGPVGDSPAGE